MLSYFSAASRNFILYRCSRLVKKYVSNPGFRPNAQEPAQDSVQNEEQHKVEDATGKIRV